MVGTNPADGFADSAGVATWGLTPDLGHPGHQILQGPEDGHLGVMKNSLPHFNTVAVALYRSRPEATRRIFAPA